MVCGERWLLREVAYQIGSGLPSSVRLGAEREMGVDEQLPPASGSEPPSIHLAHIAHANDADSKALHALGHLGGLR